MPLAPCLWWQQKFNYYYILVQKDDADNDGFDNDKEMGGLFRVASKSKKKNTSLQHEINGLDSSKIVLDSIQDWDLQEVSYCDLFYSYLLYSMDVFMMLNIFILSILTGY